MKISCIIPAYNEAPRIGAVLSAASACALVDEIIAIDDCSTDNTSAVISEYPKAKCIRLPTNQGKSRAVCEGMKTATGDIIVTLDADLIGLTSQNVADLLRPVISGYVAMSISFRDTYPIKDRMSAFIGFDHLSGERAFRKELIMPHLKEISHLHGFGLETFINKLIVKNNYPIQIVPWKNVVSPLKSYKYNIRGFLAEPTFFFGMWISVFQVVSPLEVFRIIRAMKKLRRSGN